MWRRRRHVGGRNLATMMPTPSLKSLGIRNEKNWAIEIVEKQGRKTKEKIFCPRNERGQFVTR